MRAVSEAGRGHEMTTAQEGERSMSDHTFRPGPTPNTVRAADGRVLTAPEGWLLLPPGDAALTRRVKAAGDHWTVQEKKGRKVFSRGVWAPATTIDRIRADAHGPNSVANLNRTPENAEKSGHLSTVATNLGP